MKNKVKGKGEFLIRPNLVGPQAVETGKEVITLHLFSTIDFSLGQIRYLGSMKEGKELCKDYG